MDDNFPPMCYIRRDVAGCSGLSERAPARRSSWLKRNSLIFSFSAVAQRANFWPGTGPRRISDGRRGTPTDRRLVPQHQLPPEQKRDLERQGRRSGPPRGRVRAAHVRTDTGGEFPGTDTSRPGLSAMIEPLADRRPVWKSGGACHDLAP
jgi:hypothetical protein